MNVKLSYLTKYYIIVALLISSFAVNSKIIRHSKNRANWHSGNIHHFEINDRAIWRSGHWQHVSYSGRLGWWWVVGPSWYYYPRPIYPYPDPYIPPQKISLASPPVQSWYYCESKQDYYPYIQTCEGGWKTIPITPPNK